MKTTSIFSIFIGLVICGVLLYGQYDSNQVYDQLLEDQAVSRVEQANNLTTAKLQTRLEDSVSALQAYAVLIEGEEPEKMYTAESLEDMYQFLHVYGFEKIAICNMEGKAFDTSGKSFDVSEDEYFTRGLLGDTTISYIEYQPTLDEKTVVFQLPIFAEGQVTAVLRTAWGTDVISSILSTSGFRGKEDVCIVDQNSNIIRSLSGIYENQGTLLSLWEKKDNTYLNMEQVMKQGRSYSVLVTDKKEKQYYLAYNGIRKMNDWGVATIILRDDLVPLLTGSFHSVMDYLYVAVAVAGMLVLLYLLLYQSKKRYRLERLAYIDQVTKSYNFKGFMKRVNQMFETDPTSKFAFLEVTLDKFDYFVETFGDDEKNRTLFDVASIIGKYIHDDEAYCRYNTINFIIMLKYQNDEELKDRILYLKDKIHSYEGRNRVNDKFEYNFLVGIYCVDKKDIGIDAMIHRADMALTAALNNKKSPFEFYQLSMENSRTEDREYEEHMYQALHEKEFLVYLQPKFSLKTGKQVGAEALVRWMHPEKGLLYPGRFISLFEKNGFIVELDMYILEELCRRLKIWIRKGIKPMPLSFNVSMHNLFNGDFVEKVTEIVERYGVPANLIGLEIGEEAVVNNIKLVQEILEQLKLKGFLISMDDFGVGTTSMNTLYQVPIDELKIDRKFLMETEKSDRGISIINSIIDTAKRLDIQVVAEGVDNKSQAQSLRDLGCDMMQGFVFSEPLPEKEYDEYAYGARSAENKISI